MEEHQKSNKNITENSNFLTPLFGSIQNKEKTEPDKLSYSWRTPKFETMQCSKILVPSFSLHFLPNQTRSFSLVTYWPWFQPLTLSYHCHSRWDTLQMDGFSPNLKKENKIKNKKELKIVLLIGVTLLIAKTWRGWSWKLQQSKLPLIAMHLAANTLTRSWGASFIFV